MSEEILTDFEIVWRQYPRKTAKAVARKAWRKLKPDTSTVQLMIDALTWQKDTEQWKRGVIPHFSTWLNQARWEDEAPGTRNGHGSPAPSAAELAQVARIRARQRRDFELDAEEYYRTHSGKPS